jgi:hypothetical protein
MMYTQDDFQAKEDSMVFHSHTMALIYVEVLYCQDWNSVLHAQGCLLLRLSTANAWVYVQM